MVRVTTDSEATPFERVIARRLRASAGDARDGILRSLDSVVEIVSRTDPQRSIVRFRGMETSVDREVLAGADCRLITNGIALDEFEVAEPTEESEDIISVLLPPSITWQAAAQAFWQRAGQREGLPASLRILNLDDQDELRFGGDGEPEYEIQGGVEALISVLDGRSLFLELLYYRRLFLRGSLRHLSVLSGVGMDVMLDV